MERKALRDELTTSVTRNRDELFRLRREHTRLLNAATANGPETAEGVEALRTADQVGSSMLHALDVYERALARLSSFARMPDQVRITDLNNAKH